MAATTAITVKNDSTVSATGHRRRRKRAWHPSTDATPTI